MSNERFDHRPRSAGGRHAEARFLIALTAALRDHLERNEMTAVIKPPPLRPAVAGGFSIDDFEVGDTDRTVTCPAGVVVPPQRRSTGPVRP